MILMLWKLSRDELDLKEMEAELIKEICVGVSIPIFAVNMQTDWLNQTV